MNTHEFDPDAVVDAVSPLLGLTLSAESRAQTILHLRIAAHQAELLLAVETRDDDEPAPVFCP
jgi:hypothetical protein